MGEEDKTRKPECSPCGGPLLFSDRPAEAHREDRPCLQHLATRLDAFAKATSPSPGEALFLARERDEARADARKGWRQAEAAYQARLLDNESSFQEKESLRTRVTWLEKEMQISTAGEGRATAAAARWKALAKALRARARKALP